jgi:tetratricopeptide (TPR) repeat protein
MNNSQRRWSGWVMLMGMFLGCDTVIHVGTAVQSGRQALLRKDHAQALVHFEQAARKDPDYVYRSAHFSEGIWTYVGRCQYATGNLAQARQSLDMALTKDQDDLLGQPLGRNLLGPQPTDSQGDQENTCAYGGEQRRSRADLEQRGVARYGSRGRNRTGAARGKPTPRIDSPWQRQIVFGRNFSLGKQSSCG